MAVSKPLVTGSVATEGSSGLPPDVMGPTEVTDKRGHTYGGADQGVVGVLNPQTEWKDQDG